MTEYSDNDSSIETLQSRSAGSDPEDPYDDVDISELPDWWQSAIEEHREYGLRPYRPPRFEDGTLKHTVVERLEEKHDIRIDFIDLQVENSTWKIRVDGEIIGEIGRHRSPEGYTVFEMDPQEFERYILSQLQE